MSRRVGWVIGILIASIIIGYYLIMSLSGGRAVIFF